MVPDWNRTYMDFAKLIAKHSKAEKEKVGCVIVKDGQVISTGYNGTPPGYDNKCEDEVHHGRLVTRKEVIHAEINALTKVAKSTISSAEATLFVTKAPCYECAKAIIVSGIRVVVFKGEKGEECSSIGFLNKNGVITIPLSEQGSYTK